MGRAVAMHKKNIPSQSVSVMVTSSLLLFLFGCGLPAAEGEKKTVAAPSAQEKTSSAEKGQPAYIRQREITKQRIEAIGRGFNFDSIPCYAVTIKETEKSITAKRQTYRAAFDKKKCTISEVDIEGVVFSKLTFPNAVIVDELGRRYEQRFAKKGDLKCIQRSDRILFEGFVYPATESGQSCSIKLKYTYTLDKMTGIITVDVTAQIMDVATFKAYKVSRLTFENGLGSRRFFPYYYIVEQSYENDWNSDGKRPADVEPMNHGRLKGASDGIVKTGKFVQASWVGGGRGFQILPITWEGTRDTVDNQAVMDYKFTTVEVRDGANLVDMTFVNLPGRAVDINASRFTYAFAFLPFKKYRFRPVYFGNLGAQASGGGMSLTEGEKRTIAKMKEGGVDLVCCAPNNHLGGIWPDRPKEFRKNLDYCHSLGIKVILYIDSQVWDTKYFVEQGLAGRGEIEIGQYIMGDRKFPGQSCRNYEGYRLFLLTDIRKVLEEFDIDGIYLDNMGIANCRNTLHGCSSQTSFNSTGSAEYMKSLRLLLGQDKIIMANYGHMCASVGALIDYAYSGEGFVDEKIPEIGDGVLHTYFDSLLCGYQMIATNFQSYDISSDLDVNGKYPRVFEQLLSRSTLLPCNYFPNFEDDDPSNDTINKEHYEAYKSFHYGKTRKMLFDRYTSPLRKFGGDGVETISPYHANYEKYVESDCKDLWVNVYAKSGTEALVVVVNQPHKRRQATVRVNVGRLGFGEGKLVLYDAIADPAGEAGREMQSPEGWIELGKLDVSKGPRIILLKMR